MSTAIGHVKPQCVQSSDQKDDLRKAEKRNCKTPNINTHETLKKWKQQLYWTETATDAATKH